MNAMMELKRKRKWTDDEKDVVRFRYDSTEATSDFLVGIINV